MPAGSTIETARRRYVVLKELVRRERNNSKNYQRLDRLYELGVLQKGMPGDPRRVAQETLDALDQTIDAFGFLDVVAAFEVEACSRIDRLIADTRGKLRKDVQAGVTAPAAPHLVRGLGEFEESLKLVLDAISANSPAVEVESCNAIRETRNSIAHGRTPLSLPLPVSDLASLLTRLLERQLTR